MKFEIELFDHILDTTQPRIFQLEMLVVHLVALICNEFEKGMEYDDNKKKTFYRNLEKVSKSITHLDEDPTISSIERIINNQDSLKLIQRLEIFIDHAIYVMQWESIILIISDLLRADSSEIIVKLLKSKWAVGAIRGQIRYCT